MIYTVHALLGSMQGKNARRVQDVAVGRDFSQEVMGTFD